MDPDATDRQEEAELIEAMATDRFWRVAGETVREIKARLNDGADPRLSDGVASCFEDLSYR